MSQLPQEHTTNVPPTQSRGTHAAMHTQCRANPPHNVCSSLEQYFAPATARAILLPWKFQCSRQKVCQWCKGPTGFGKDVHKIGRTGLCLREISERNIILALQVCQQRVLRVVPVRVALERVTAQAASGAEGLGGDDALPALRMRHDGIANLRERVLVRMPHTAGDKHRPRLEVQVKARGMGIAASFVAKMCSSVRLIRTLVLGEAHIAMDAKQRATIGASVGNEAWADLPQAWPKVSDEMQHGIAYFPPIALLVGLKPLTVVVTVQGLKEGKQSWIKVGLCGHECLSVPLLFPSPRVERD